MCEMEIVFSKTEKRLVAKYETNDYNVSAKFKMNVSKDSNELEQRAKNVFSRFNEIIREQQKQDGLSPRAKLVASEETITTA